MATHDPSYKLLFSHRDLVADLIRGFVHEDWVADLDFCTLQRFSEISRPGARSFHAAGQGPGLSTCVDSA
jgi:hypothetical protein